MPRVHAVDLGRTVALVGMVVFHFARDLEFFGLLPLGTTLTGVWYVLARVAAGGFFFFAGISLVLGHSTGIRWRAFWWRFAVISAAALSISAITYAAFPSQFIYFGILHSIAVCSVIGLLFLGLPISAAMVAAFLALSVHLADIHPLNSAVWSFTGLSEAVRPSLDLLPLIPWIAAFFAGMTVARLWAPQATPMNRAMRILGWPGRHSLWIYLFHQPILVAGIWIATKWIA